MSSIVPDKVKTLDKYAWSMICVALVFETIIVYSEWPSMTINVFSTLMHVFLILNFTCGVLLLCRYKAGLRLFTFLVPQLFYRFYQQGEKEKAKNLARSEEVVSYFNKK